MNEFIRPLCEVVRFDKGTDIIASSPGCNPNICGCYDGEDDWGAGANCNPDYGPPACICQVNYDPAVANCIIP